MPNTSLLDCGLVAIIAASILDSDFSNLRGEIEEVDRAGVDMFSLDVMDGHFAPRITFGDYVVACVRTWTSLPIEAHLMIQSPERWVERFIDVGADLVLFHLEATTVHRDVIAEIRGRNRSAGMAILASPPVEQLFDWVPSVNVVNFLAVPVGFGGQQSAPDTCQRIRALRAVADHVNPNLVIEVDGGIKPENAEAYVAAGADMLTVGTGIYHAPNRMEAVRRLKTGTAGAADAIGRSRGSMFLQRRERSHLDRARLSRRLRELSEELGAPTENLL